jgi:cell division initiation protein
MRITPIDVRRKEFGRAMRGYDANQVDDFLDEVADEFERVYSENSRMRDELDSLKSRLEQFDELEGSIREALVHAQQSAEDLRRTAGKEAELTVREAKARAHQILAESSARVERIQESYEALRKAKQSFAADFRQLLKSYMDVMENMDIASAKEIEKSLNERLDTESIAAAREAAERQRLELQQSETPPPIVSDEDEDETQAYRGPLTEEAAEPEVREPEVEPSSAEEDFSGETTRIARNSEAPAEAPAEEVEREGEPIISETQPADDTGELDDTGDLAPREEEREEEDPRRARAGRFLRRRG